MRWDEIEMRLRWDWDEIEMKIEIRLRWDWDEIRSDQMRSDEMRLRWDEMRWDEMRWDEIEIEIEIEIEMRWDEMRNSRFLLCVKKLFSAMEKCIAMASLNTAIYLIFLNKFLNEKKIFWKTKIYCLL